ncbi:MAG: SDR family NAD-dependent epimerase/dehydratase, partial [Thermodesulfobacteriota bacterium]
LELATRIKDITGSKSKLVYKPLPEDDPVQRQPDIELAIKELDWRPSVGLEDGLARTIDFFKKRLTKGK